MNRFMIGQYGGFNYKKYHRDFRASFWGIEACLFEDEQDIENLVNLSKQDGFRIGVHFPLRAGVSPFRDALFLAHDEDTRQQAFDHIEQELDYLVRVQPEYILFHYPKPVILDDRADWKNWRFADSREFVYESQYSFEALKEKSEQLFEWLALKAEKYGFIPVLEFDALNAYVYESDFLESLFIRYPTIKCCLDTGRLYLQERTDPHFNARLVIRKYAKYAEILHLSTLKINEQIEHYKYPALPHLDPNEGWAPIEDYLRILKEENPDTRIMFEHRSDLISDEQLEACYQWVHGLLK
ncbi:sugar phosphate isomerase/epimerase family protein [Paenibacillus agricola]|uniref:Sugar phosphate isomerase/epimerase n=1 Tax=Paenibacillus agricola TaxID=2716264 RepID=A0ABX0JC12_9BACL|nr:TIM barrel protein [Paenibacillus agricola]NHN32412.1 sugar phosphate isomerase/epimerase [Paenibacillus agricola]